MKEEFCIMEDNPPFWRNHRETGLVRHEIFYGRKNRQKSIEDGLVIFLRPEDHNMSNYGIHFNKTFDLETKKLAQKQYMCYYNKSIDEFIARYGRNYL